MLWLNAAFHFYDTAHHFVFNIQCSNSVKYSSNIKGRVFVVSESRRACGGAWASWWVHADHCGSGPVWLGPFWLWSSQQNWRTSEEHVFGYRVWVYITHRNPTTKHTLPQMCMPDTCTQMTTLNHTSRIWESGKYSHPSSSPCCCKKYHVLPFSNWSVFSESIMHLKDWRHLPNHWGFIRSEGLHQFYGWSVKNL